MQQSPDDSAATRLARAAQRAERDPFFLAAALARYREREGLDKAALAEWLGCDTDALVHLALCRMPSGTSSRFRADIERIATHTGASAERLLDLVRAVQVDTALRRVSEQPGPYTTEEPPDA